MPHFRNGLKLRRICKPGSASWASRAYPSFFKNTSTKWLRKEEIMVATSTAVATLNLFDAAIARDVLLRTRPSSDLQWEIWWRVPLSGISLKPVFTPNMSSQNFTSKSTTVSVVPSICTSSVYGRRKADATERPLHEYGTGMARKSTLLSRQLRMLKPLPPGREARKIIRLMFYVLQSHTLFMITNAIMHILPETTCRWDEIFSYLSPRVFIVRLIWFWEFGKQGSERQLCSFYDKLNWKFITLWYDFTKFPQKECRCVHKDNSTGGIPTINVARISKNGSQPTAPIVAPNCPRNVSKPPKSLVCGVILFTRSRCLQARATILIVPAQRQEPKFLPWVYLVDVLLCLPPFLATITIAVRRGSHEEK